MYHNTTQSTQPELGQYQDKAKSQEERINRYIRGVIAEQMTSAHHYFCGTQYFTPSMVRSHVFNDEVPLTSVRRAMTNLTDDGHLVKTDRQFPGPYGRPEFGWRPLPKQGEMF